MITDRQGIVEYVNPAFEALTGYQRSEVCGSAPRILKSGEQGPEVYQEMWKTILSRECLSRHSGEPQKKRRIVLRGGKHLSHSRWRWTDHALHIEWTRSDGAPSPGSATIARLRRWMRFGRLAGGVAHDFNNLLTIITSYSELALDVVPQNSPLESKIQEIRQAARRAAELTRQLLTFSRKQPQALRIVELNTILASISKTLPRLIGEDIDFTFAPAECIGRVRVDPVQIEQVLMNLAANARDAMPQGGHLCIATSDVHLDDDYVHGKPAVIPKGHYALITVSDDGSGIPAEDLPHIFEPFYTTKPSGKGTGLGLATVYGIVKQNKGFIWVYSEQGEGTVFKIYLPCLEGRIAALTRISSDSK